MKQQAMAKRTADKEAGNCQVTGLQENLATSSPTFFSALVVAPWLNEKNPSVGV